LISYSIDEINKVLQTYTFEDIAEHNDVLIEDVLEMLIKEYHWELPKPAPLCGDDASYAR